MDLENTLNGHSEPASMSAPAPAPAPAPPPPPPMPRQGNGSDGEITGITEHGKFNSSGMLLWLCAVVAITATAYFWFLNSSATQKLTDKQNELATTIAEISSPTYADVEAKATAFQAAVSQLKTAESSRYVMSDFLPLLYGRILKNVAVTNLAVDSAGKLSFDAKTDSYKSAAEQLVSLQSWKINDKNVISGAQLLSESEDVTKGVVVTFAISGNIDKTVSLKTATSSSTQGGN